MKKALFPILALILTLGLMLPMATPAMAATSGKITTVSVTDLTPGTAAQGTLKIPILEFTVRSSDASEKLKKVEVTYTGTALEDIAAMYLYQESGGSGGTFDPATDIQMVSVTSPSTSPINLDPDDFAMTQNVNYQFYIVVDLKSLVPDYRNCVATKIDAKIEEDKITFKSGKSDTWPPSAETALWNPSGETQIQNTTPWSLSLPTDDSWVNEKTAEVDDNFGTKDTLHVRWQLLGEERRAYLQFDLSCLPPCTVIDSAILHVYRNKDTGVPSAYKTTDNWTEGTITWTNKPLLGDKVVDGSGTASPEAQWLTWDIKDYAASESAGDNTLSIVLKFETGPIKDDAHHADLNSKEASSNKPWLEISYHTALPSCTITATSPVCAGSTGNTASVPDAGTGASYSWNITSNGIIVGSSTDSSITYTAGSSGNVTLTITVNLGNCSCNSNIDIPINPAPDCTITPNPASVCANSTGNTASVTAVSGATYGWSITGNGTITSTPPYTNSITWNATGAGTATIDITITDPSGCSCTNGGTAVTVNAAPNCNITAPSSVCANSTGNTASVTAVSGATYSWSITGNGTITSTPPYTNSVTWNATGAGTATIAITITDPSGCSCTNGGTAVTVNPAPVCTITADPSVCALSTGHTASVPDAGTGAAYNWTISNGNITAGQGTNSVTWDAGSTSPVTIGITITGGANCSGVIVSDNNTMVTQGNVLGATYPHNAVLAWVHGSWWSSLTPYKFGYPSNTAQWIWESDPVVDPINGDVVYFQRSFNIPGTPTGATLYITCDNGYEAYINGNYLGRAQLEDGWEASNLTENWVHSQDWQSVETWTVPASMLINGTNTLEIKTANEYFGPLDNQSPPGTVDSNPAGLIYELVYEFTGSCGCTCNSNTNVTVNAKPATPTAGSNSPVCEGATLNLTALPNGMSQYNWYGPDGWTSILQNPTRTNATSTMGGAYNLSVTLGNCTSDNATTDVVVNTKPIASASSNSPVCEGGTIQLTGGSDNMTSYSWSGPNSFTSAVQSPSIPSATSAMAGTYTLSVTLGNCTSDNATTDVVVNTKPIATASSSSPCCVGGAIQLIGGSDNMTLYSWTGPNGYTSDLQSPTITNATTAMAGVYRLTVTDSNGCTSDPETTPSVAVAVNEKPVATASATTPVCIGATIQLTGGSDNMTSYSWSGPNSFTSAVQSPSISSATSAMAGTYTLIVTLGNCTSDNATAAVSVVNCGGGGGGGGGSWGSISSATAACPLSVTVNMLGGMTTARMTFKGVLCEDCLASDPTGQNSWEAKEGTQLLCAGNIPPQLIELTLAGSPPPPSNAAIVGPIYDFTAYTSKYNPSPLTISPAATLALAYDPNKQPENISALTIAYYDENAGKWVEMETAGYVAGGVEVPNVLTTHVTHLTYFAVLAKLAEPTPAKFQASNLTISPSQAQLNQEVAISVNVANTGGTSGSYSLELTVNGISKSTKQVTVAAGTSQTVNFTITGDAAGKNQVEVAGLAGEFEITKAAKQSQINWWLIGGITGIILLIIIGLIVRRRQLRGY